MKTAFLLFFLIIMLFSLRANAQQGFNSLNVKELAISGSVNVNSTTKSSKPCPEMTEAERDLIATPATGSCIYNSDTLTLNVYNGAAWKSAGGGVNQWATSASYQVDDVIIESSKFYVCLVAHTSGTFATDLASLNWEEVSEGLTGVIPLANGGTAKNITASNGAIAYSDADSLELLAHGTAGQVLQTNGAAAPTFVNKSISVKSENGSSVTLEEIQVPNNQLTQTATNKHLLNDCGSSNNLLANCGFEHSTPATGWTLASGTSAVMNKANVPDRPYVNQGNQSLKLTLSAQALNFKQTSTLNVEAFADGVNGSISKSVKTTMDNIYLCRTDSAGAVVASTNGTKITNCVLAPNNGKWSDLVMPIILGATQNGLALVSLTPSTAAAVNVTGDVFVDSGVLESGLKATSQSVCTTASCETEFGAFVSPTGVVTTENMEWITGNASLTDTSLYTFTISGFTVAPTCTVTPVTSTSTENVTARLEALASSTSIVVRTGFSTTASSFTKTAYNHYIKCQKQGVDFTNAKALASGRFYTVPSDSFSTDTNTLGHKATAIVASDPIGTYNTYSYAINTNTKTICGSAPSTLPTSANGFLIFTRAYNAPSTCGNPARVEIKIGAAGTKFPTIKTDIYKSAAKVTSGTFDFMLDSASAVGAWTNAYNESTGILIVDAAFQVSTITSSSFFYSDGTFQTSGYLVINAQKAKDSIVGSFAEVVTMPNVTKPIHFSYRTTAACTTGTCAGEALGSVLTSTSATFSATGDYNIAIPSGKCLATPYCTGGIRAFSAHTNKCSIIMSSTTLVKAICTNTAGANVNEGFAVSCVCESP